MARRPPVKLIASSPEFEAPSLFCSVAYHANPHRKSMRGRIRCSASLVRVDLGGGTGWGTVQEDHEQSHHFGSQLSRGGCVCYCGHGNLIALL